MEATGFNWIPVYEILDARGFQVILVNAMHVKNCPGRKSDVSDCEWLRDLHILGLLHDSFRPTDAIVALRGYLWHRATLIEFAGALAQRMQKALVQMNVQLPLVVSELFDAYQRRDITGVTGLRVLRDIVAGRRDPRGDQNLNRRNHEVRSQCGGGTKHPPIPLHDSRRSVRYKVASRAGNIGTHDWHAALRGTGDVTGSRARGQVIRARLYRDVSWPIDVVCQPALQGLGEQRSATPRVSHRSTCWRISEGTPASAHAASGAWYAATFIALRTGCGRGTLSDQVKGGAHTARPG